MSPYLKSFKAYLQLERSMAEHTVESYLRDAGMLLTYLADEERGLALTEVKLAHLQGFVRAIHELGLAPASQARILSGIKSFFRFLLLEGTIAIDPTELLSAPKTRRPLPEVLSTADIDAMIAAIDHSTPEGMRNRAMLEVLYSSGLRVSELTGLQISNLYLDIGFLRIIGKGHKERLVPLGAEAAKQNSLYKKTHAKVFS